MKKSVLALLFLSLVCGQISCGNTVESSADTAVNTVSDETSAVEEEPAYVYPALDLKGKSFDILNSDTIYSIYMNIDWEKETGETLDDAVYNRCRFIEDKFNCDINVTEFPSGGTGFDPITRQAESLILSGDDTYEVMYLKIAANLGLMTGGGLVDLRSLSGLQLDEEWWDKIVAESAVINGKLYFTTGCLQLMPFESTWCIYFNEDIFTNRKIAMPYDAVRNGTWTLESMMKICTENAALNGDESFVWKNGGNSLYGVATHSNAIDCYLYGCNVRFAAPDKNGFAFTLAGDKFYNICEQLASFTASEGAYFKASSSDWDAEKGGYIYTFANDRALFLTAQIKTANQLREMKSEFGVLPFPKADAAQEDYYAYVTNNNLVMTIPSTNKDADTTALILDALTYRSYETVLPVYYENRVSQKGLRNDNSIEMLDIIRHGRGIDIADYYLWSSSLRSSLKTSLLNSDGKTASLVESGRSAFEESMNGFLSDIR